MVQTKKRNSIGIYEKLKEEILSLEMKPGSAMDEANLAIRFGTSRTPVREALLMLANEHLVSRNSIVTPHTMENAGDYFDTLILLSRSIFITASKSRTQDDLVVFKEYLNTYADAVKQGDIDVIIHGDLKLKRSIADSTGGYFCYKYYLDCLNSGRRMKKLHYYTSATPQDLQDTVTCMKNIIKAIETQDAKMCDGLVIGHIQDELKIIQRSFAPKLSQEFNIVT